MAGYQVLRTVGRTLGAVMVTGLIGGTPAAAHVGLSSNVAQVALLVRLAPRASIQGVGSPVRSGSNGSMTEASVKVRLSTNTGYRLMAVGLPSSRGSRVWVRSATGEFQELTGHLGNGRGGFAQRRPV